MATSNIDIWLGSIGLAQYSGLFRLNEIDDDLLSRLTSDDLKEMGVAALGHRRKLLDAIAALAVTVHAPLAIPDVPSTSSAAERRHLTVMFIDLVGSTAISAQLDPEDMRDLIHSYQSAVASEILRFEGHVAQFLGDGVLAYFGWPRAHEDDVERAVRAGLAVTAAVIRLKAPSEKNLLTRIGIATGMVVVGDLIAEGTTQRHAVVGETPNLAARVQAMAESGMVVITESTRRLAGDLFVLRNLGPQTFKGIAEQTPVFAVLGERSLESRFAARQSGKLTPVVGRDQELALLVEHWQEAKAAEGQVVLLSGEAGIGKSRIAEAIVEAAKGEPHYLLRYQCSPYHADSALFPVIQQLIHAASVDDDDDTEHRLNRIEALLAQATEDWHEAAPLMAALLGVDGTSRYGISNLTPQQRRSRTLACLIDQLTGLASRKPVLWVIEDAHWIDPTTLELIELALDRVQDSRVLALITSRPTFVASFGSHPVVTRLALNRLGRTATLAIVARITRGKRMPAALLDEISTKTDGVPLFVEETTKAILESGVLREDAEAYHLDGPLSALSIPATLHDSLMARLDRLQPVKEVAQIAAVIGRRFDHRTIAALVALPEHELANAMRQLAEAELIFRRGTPPDATYLFKHALVRDAAYESLLKTKRVALHAQLLDVLEAQGDAAPEVKAQHAESANLNGRALDYCEQAGTQALARPAYKEAISSLENAIRLCRTEGHDLRFKRREQSLHLKLGQALIANLGHQAAATQLAFESAMQLADEIGDVSLQIPAMYGRWSGHYAAGTDSGNLGERFLALADTLVESGPRVIGLRMLGSERFHSGLFSESLDFLTKSLAAYDPRVHSDLKLRFGQDPRVIATIFLSRNLWHLGFPDQAADAIDESLRLAREVDHANTTGYTLGYGMTVSNIWLRRADRVESSAREAREFSERMSLALWHAISQIYLGWALSQQGKASGLEEIEAGMRAYGRLGASRFEAFHLGLAADAYSHAGRHDDAREKIDAAFAALATGRDLVLAAELHRTRAVLLLRAEGGECEVAKTDLRRALEIAREQRALALQLRAGRDLARVLIEQGEIQQATDLLAPIYAEFTEGFETPDLLEARALLNELKA